MQKQIEVVCNEYFSEACSCEFNHCSSLLRVCLVWFHFIFFLSLSFNFLILYRCTLFSSKSWFSSFILPIRSSSVMSLHLMISLFMYFLFPQFLFINSYHQVPLPSSFLSYSSSHVPLFQTSADSQYRPNNLEMYLLPLIMQAINISVKYLARRNPRTIHPWRSAAPSGGGRRNITRLAASRRYERKSVGRLCHASRIQSELPTCWQPATRDSLSTPHVVVPRAKNTSVHFLRSRHMI